MGPVKVRALGARLAAMAALTAVAVVGIYQIGDLCFRSSFKWNRHVRLASRRAHEKHASVHDVSVRQ